jgi:predicted O-linked N-acetylglucosamine transferase (SPINDLY family)
VKGFVEPLSVDSASGSAAKDVQALFDRALADHLAGRLELAQHGYESYLSRLQSLPVVRTNLAAIYLQQGRYQEAGRLLDLALMEAPSYAEALCNRGYLAILQGDQDLAVTYLEKALEQSPALVPALSHLVPLYRRLERSQEALALVDRALQAQPEQASLLEQRAHLLQALHGSESALTYLQQALEQANSVSKPALLSAFARHLLLQSTDLPSALTAFEQAIAATASPSVTDLVNKGEVLRRLARRDEAVAWVNHCLMMHPNDASLINLKACIYQDLGQINDALTLYGMALAVDPANAQIQSNRGFLLNDQGRHREALTAFEAGSAINPAHAGCHHGLAQSAFHLGKPSFANKHYQSATELDPDNLNIWDNYLYFLSFTRHLSDADHLFECDRYAQLALAPRVGKHATDFHHSFSDPSSRPLKVGIISAEIGSHCVSYFLLSLLKGASKSQAAFYLFPSKDRHTEPRWNDFKQLSTHFECIEQLSDDKACELIRSFNLDVVLETSQHMTSNRLALMARRLAPIQSHYIGMHGTTGVPAIDYFIGDSWITPPEFAGQFTETLLPLSRTWVCFTPPDRLPALRATEGKPALRLGCFNNVSKISRECMRLWAKVLLDIPESSLVVKDSLRRGDLGMTDHQQELVNYLHKRGVNRDRIHILPRTESWDAHMDLYNDIDIALDTTPLASGTTAFDALLMGTPIVAHSSNWIGGRLSASIVAGYGQSDWIATTEDEYVAIIRKLGRALVGLRNGRAKRREQFLNSELCDHKGLAADLLENLRTLYAQKLTASATEPQSNSPKKPAKSLTKAKS